MKPAGLKPVFEMRTGPQRESVRDCHGLCSLVLQWDAVRCRVTDVVHAGRRCPEHGLLKSASPPHDKADICAVWDALCFGLPPPLALSSPGLSPGIQGDSPLALPTWGLCKLHLHTCGHLPKSLGARHDGQACPRMRCPLARLGPCA